MALKLIVLLMCMFATTRGEMALENITRLATGDLFSLVGTDCGPTRCMEMSHGTALAALGDGCVCRCRKDTPAFREDRRVCVNHIDECAMASFGRGATKPQIPFVFLPLKGQIIYPSKEIVFTDVEDAICAVTSAQYLSPSGWVTLRDLIDNDVPFGLYRDEGSTFLQWRGSAALHDRLEGRLVAAHVLCSASTASQLAASCAAFRVAGATQNALLDVRSIPFHAGEVVTTESTNQQNQGLSVLESLAIGVCALMLIFIYAAGIIFYVHYKQKQKRKQKDPEQTMSSNSSENGSSLEARIDMSNVMMKTNPLLKLGGMGNDFLHDNGFSDTSEHNSDTLDSSSNNTHNHNNHKLQKMNSNVISAMVHSRKIKKPPRPSLRQAASSEKYNERLQRRSSSPDTFERAPQSDLSIVDCSVEDHNAANRHLTSDGEPMIRRKLYFNPIFFETEHLKNPPPAAVEFLVKIREVMSIAKDKMSSKRFIPMLSDIPEDNLYQGIDLGWDFPCARRGRRFSAISLKQENSRKAGVSCEGCPGCDSKKPQKVALTRSNSCKSCVSDDYKQRIVRKWLDEVPTPSAASKSVKSIAKVNGTPKVIEPKLESDTSQKKKELIRPKSAEPISQKEESKASKEVTSNTKKVTNKPPKVTEAIPKNASKLTEIIPNIAALMTESIPNKTSKAPEIITKKLIIDSVPKENPNLLVETVATTDNNVTNKINGSNSEENLSKLTQINNPFTQENKKPSKHASRRIRKKLPPPPPPPAKVLDATKPPEEAAPIPREVKVKMEAVIREFNHCRRVEPKEIEEIKLETTQPIPAPKIVIPVVAADSHYFSDDNMLFNPRKTDLHIHRDSTMEFDSLERSLVRRRRFSLACGPELSQQDIFGKDNRSYLERQRFASSWLDMNKAFENDAEISPREFSHVEHQPVSEVFIGSSEPFYDNLTKPGPLTIQVRGSPVEKRRNVFDDFDPDTLERKPKRDVKKRIEKILLKSAGSFKYKSTSSESESLQRSPEVIFKNRIGNLRQIYETKAKAQEEENYFYKRRGSLQYGGKDLTDFMKVRKTPDLIRHLESQKDPKPPVAPKYRHSADLSPKFGVPTRESPPGDRRRVSEQRDRFGAYCRAENLNDRRSGRRSARTRSRRTDLRKINRTEDSGYMSTDSNESKRRAKYLMQLRPKNIMPEISPMPLPRTVNKPPIVIESDTDELESLCDGRSESGGESVETDSVFFGNFDDSKELLAELGLHTFEPRNKMIHVHEQIDSGFMGETNIILSGDSDSEHRSVISIMTGREVRGPPKKVDDSPYMHTIEC